MNLACRGKPRKTTQEMKLGQKKNIYFQNTYDDESAEEIQPMKLRVLVSY